ncbi:hypothetical protein [Deinococcus sp. Marseille-Q6407]|uniref:hypothetical protein n=1 Tax=Deinococcus sp. Marseille-Q6407 TaxID=2969223 RepID=UPI0021C24DBD|nr:hypothetical protein [Deinococcus sp. Marseille-Q6407]
MELHLHRGELRALFVDGFPVREALRVQDILRQLMNGATGTYEFEAMAPGELTTHFSLPLAQVLRSLVQDAHIDESQLPHESTRFVTVPDAESQVPSLPVALQGAWRSVAPLLSRGGSATELAQTAFISLDEARLMLFRLRAAGMVTPYRAAGVVSPAGSPVQFESQVAAAAEPEKAGPVRRFLNALRRLTGGA